MTAPAAPPVTPPVPPCPEGWHEMPDGTCMQDMDMMPEEMAAEADEFHLPGKHNQKEHGHGGGAGTPVRTVSKGGGQKQTIAPGWRPNPKTHPGWKPGDKLAAEAETFAAADGGTVAEPLVDGQADYEQQSQPLEEMAGTPWWAPLVVEGEWSGDGRQFEAGALTWVDPPASFKWQPAELPRHYGAVAVARIDGFARLGDQILAWGVWDDQGEYGAEALRLAQGGFVTGVSLMADDMEAADVELVWPAGAEDQGSGLMLMATDNAEGGPAPAGLPTALPPEPRELYHGGRIRSATLLPEAAFVECRIQFGPPPPEVQAAMVAAAVGAHDSATSDGTWNGPANEKRLPSPMPVATARAAYAWVDDAKVADGQIPKDGGRFIHHEVGADGNPGAANLTACSTGIGVLNGGLGGTTIPAEDVRGVYNHLAAHLRSADREPPPLEASTGPTAVTAAGWTMTIPEVWPAGWFDKPSQPPAFGALHVTDEGRIFGYLGPDQVAHRAFRASGRHVTIPRGVDYSEFMNKPAIVADANGRTYRINAGNITMNCGHPSPYDSRRADPNWAMQQYDNACSIVARVRVGEDEHGTWVAGGLLHGIDADTVERMMGCALSGDWQNGRLNAALLVPVEGFPVAVQGHMRVTDGAVVASSTPVRFVGAPAENLDETFELIASAVGMDTASRFEQLAAALGR